MRAGMSTKELVPRKDKSRKPRRMFSELGSSVCVSSVSSLDEEAEKEGEDVSQPKEKRKKRFKEASWK